MLSYLCFFKKKKTNKLFLEQKQNMLHYLVMTALL